jgi:putative membrane protein
MTNRQLIKSAHIWVIAVLLACALVAIAVKGGIAVQNQNSNQNGNANSNTANDNSQNRNANRSNRNASNQRATGEQTGMSPMSSQDRNFLMDAAMGGMMEVELGKLAVQNGATDAVKQFGQRMVDDHSKANTELMSLASSKGVTLATELDAKHKDHVTKLSGRTGAEFDREYVKMMVSDHNKDVSEFEKQSRKGADPDLKAFASRTLPTLQEHLQMAKALPGAERGGNSNNSPRNSNSNRSNKNGNSNRP